MIQIKILQPFRVNDSARTSIRVSVTSDFSNSVWPWQELRCLYNSIVVLLLISFQISTDTVIKDRICVSLVTLTVPVLVLLFTVYLLWKNLFWMSWHRSGLFRLTWLVSVSGDTGKTNGQRAKSRYFAYTMFSHQDLRPTFNLSEPELGSG